MKVEVGLLSPAGGTSRAESPQGQNLKLLLTAPELKGQRRGVLGKSESCKKVCRSKKAERKRKVTRDLGRDISKCKTCLAAVEAGFRVGPERSDKAGCFRHR